MNTMTTAAPTLVEQHSPGLRPEPDADTTTAGAAAASASASSTRTVLVVPLGAVEQHGPHLPLGTDGMIAEAVCRSAVETLNTDPTASAEAETQCVLAPLIPFGSSGEHEQFMGTVSIGHQQLADFLVELARSATHWCSSVRFVTGHGGNGPALRAACQLLRTEGRDAAWTGLNFALPDADAPVDAHAGHTETSLMLHLAPDLVRMEAATPGCTDPLEQILPALVRGGIHALTPTGILGDPTAATASHGARLHQHAVESLVRLLHTGHPDDDGRLR